MHAINFEIKEPEIIKWIKSFDKGDFFLDIGANVAVYSLYSAKRGFNEVSVEPDS
tara:strand:+ start:1117 stop:1281 length:165 start_codon:yes stop_codon:yes gene_type:complete